MKKVRMFEFLKALIVITAINFLGFAAAAMEQTNFKQKGQKVVEEKRLEKKKSTDKNRDDEVKETKEGKNSERQQNLEKKEQKTKGKEYKKERQTEEKNEEVIKKHLKKEAEKNIKDHEQAEKDQIKKNKNKFKDFNPKDFQVAGYELKVYKKAGIPLLDYVHRGTNAHVVFIIVEKNDLKSQSFVDKIFYRAFCNDDSGLSHLSEHCLVKFYEYFWKKYGFNLNSDVIHAITDVIGVHFKCSSRCKDNDLFFEKFFENLKNQDFLKDEEHFKLEKNRLIDEIGLFGNSFDMNAEKLRKNLRFFDHFGKTEEIKKVTFKDFKNFYEKYIHPSNMCITKHVVFDRDKITGFLDKLNKSYLNKFKFKNINSKFKYKNDDPYREFSLSDKFYGFSGKGKNDREYFKYCALIRYDLDRLKFSLEQAEGLDFELYFEKLKKIRKFVKSLGYGDFQYSFGEAYEHAGRVFFDLLLKGDDEKLFKKKILNKNVNKILEYIKQELKDIKPEKMHLFKRGMGFIENPVNTKDSEFCGFSTSYKYKFIYDMQDMITLSFAKYNKPFSTNVFYMGTNNEILDSKENILKKTKENLDSFDILIKNNPSFVDFIRADKNMKATCKKSDYQKHILPIKIKDCNDNFVVYLMASSYIRRALGYVLSFEKGYTYFHEVSPCCRCIGDYFGFLLLKENNKNKIFKFLKNDFDKLLKNFKYERSIYEKDIQKLKQPHGNGDFDVDLRREKGFMKHIKKLYRKVETFLKYEKGGFSKNNKIKNVLNCFLLSNLNEHMHDTLIFRNYSEYFKYLESGFEKCVLFLEKAYKKRNEKINREFLLDCKKYYLDYCYGLSKYRIRWFKENKKMLENVKFEDVVRAIKSAYYCDDEDYKKTVEFNNKYNTLVKKLDEMK